MKSAISTVWRFYIDGFRNMTLGRTLWLIIIVKLFVMFFVLRLFFFPKFLNSPEIGQDKGKYVGHELIHRAVSDENIPSKE
ncbi:MAG: DUF4492 domain-containing protein [Bacteroides sp.]|jgi:hypothetical protein|nr:DUF4492 domain-containing protein [Bacteroides sp.]MCI1683409.1 DUF4492 domain-containing protein [Bacteroides sp.]